jgi:hypothetical protein
MRRTNGDQKYIFHPYEELTNLAFTRWTQLLLDPLLGSSIDGRRVDAVRYKY